MDIQNIRREYTQSSLDISSVVSDPIRQFEKWFREALDSHVIEPNAFILSTISTGGRPSARVILLKGIEENNFVFFTNYQSQKGKELLENPACALTFFWPELERQVRIEGVAQQIEELKSEKYFHSRPRGSQLGAWASPQSSIIKDRAILEERSEEVEKKFSAHAIIPKPKQWGGYSVTAFEMEFWQGRPNRLHDRIVYYKTNEQWSIHRLAP